MAKQEYTIGDHNQKPRMDLDLDLEVMDGAR